MTKTLKNPNTYSDISKMKRLQTGEKQFFSLLSELKRNKKQKRLRNVD